MCNFMSKVVKKNSGNFPKLMISTDSGSIYLMVGKHGGYYTGTKLVQGATMINSSYKVGEFRSDWSGSLENFQGTVELTSN